MMTRIKLIQIFLIWGHINLKMVGFIRVSGKMVKDMEEVFIDGVMVQFMKENGKMIWQVDLVD